MRLEGSVVVVTGGGRGIGRALCERFAQERPRGIVVADLDEQAALEVARSVDGLGLRCDVGCEEDVRATVERVLGTFGRIDLFCSNAGVTAKGGPETDDDDWQRLWDVNLMSRVYAARAVLPAMLERGRGYLVHVASAAGLLTEIGSAAYSVTKHADVALAEWLAINYGGRGIGVSCVCPLGVETEMLDLDDPIHRFLHLSAISADEAAVAVVTGVHDERFLILPHPAVADFYRMKAEDPQRWLKAMRRLMEKAAWESDRGDGARPAVA